jgi:hypothetical protein
VLKAFTAIGNAKPSATATKIFLLSQGYPILLNIPLPHNTLITDLSNSMDAVVTDITDSARAGKIGQESRGSALGALCM